MSKIHDPGCSGIDASGNTCDCPQEKYLTRTQHRVSLSTGEIPMTFSIVHDLDGLSESDKKKYADSAAVHFGLDPTLNPFDFIWMTQDSGFRKLCLYARRGTTDILRDKHKISVVSLVQHDGPNYVSFIATGKNPEGRQEIAVGSSFTDGLRGEALAHAVMTAQTRALRRMTLQFAGVGILDVSEVNAPPETEQRVTTPINLSPAPVSPISHEAGKDITPVQTKVLMVAPKPFSGGSIIPDKVETVYHASSVPATLPEHSGTKLEVVEPPTQIELEQRAKIDNLVKVAEENRQKALAKVNELAEPVAEPVKKTRKPRGPNKAKVDLGPSEVPASVAVAAPRPDAFPPAAEVIPQLKAPEPPVFVVPAEQPPTPVKPRLSPDQVKPFRQRHFQIVSEVLEPAGFEPKEGMGNAAKMLSFAQMMFPDVTNMNYLTAEQWEKYLTALETKIKNEGAAATISYIEESIGL